MELTKEYFDEHLGQLNQQFDGVATLISICPSIRLHAVRLTMMVTGLPPKTLTSKPA